MIKILKAGTRKQTTCEKCGCFFSYEEEDVGHLDQNGLFTGGLKHGFKKYVECPQCKLQICIEQTRSAEIQPGAISASKIIEKAKEKEKVADWIDTGEKDEWYGKVYRCPKCNHETVDNGHFCPNCGEKLRNSVKEQIKEEKNKGEKND